MWSLGNRVEDPEETGPEPENTPEPESSTSDPPLCRSMRVRCEPEYYGFLDTDELHDPASVAEAALTAADKAKWKEAMKEEMKLLHSNDVWELVEPPPNRKIVGSKWIFKKKTDANGTVNRYKARLVAQGCSQRFGLDYEETFSLVVRFESVRAVIVLGAQCELQLHQMDVSTAFLHGELSEEVYMQQPKGFVEPGQKNQVCRLKRSIYGLKQSHRCWNQAMDSRLKEMGFKQILSVCTCLQ